MVRICVTWDVLLVLLNPPQDLTSCRAGARPGHPISGLMQCSKIYRYSITSLAVICMISGTVRPSALALSLRPAGGHLPGPARCSTRSSNFARALRRAVARLLLETRDECAQRRRRRLGRARWALRCGGQRQARIDLGEALVSPDVFAQTDDTIGERDARRAAHELAHLEARGALADVEPATITLGREEYLIIAALDHLGEVGIELDHRAPALELRCAKVLEPMLGALHAMEHALGAIGKGHDGTLDFGRHGSVLQGQVAGDQHVAPEYPRKVGALAVDADVVGKAEHSCGPVRCTDHASLRVRSAEHAGDGRQAGDRRRPLRAGHTPDAGVQFRRPDHAGERARNALHARAEERHGTNGGTGER